MKVMCHPIEKVFLELFKRRDDIYVWVITSIDGSRVTSLKVPFEAACSWCLQYANNNGGQVPVFFATKEIFLGYAPVA